MQPITLRTREELARRIAGEKAAVLLLDFDGTLAPVKSDPDAVYLSARTHRLLEELGQYYQIAIISGRALVDIRTRVGIPGLWYAGNYGLEWVIDGENGEADVPRAEHAAVRAIADGLQPIARAFPGMLIEDKDKTVIARFGRVRAHQRPEAIAAIQKLVALHRAAGNVSVRENASDFDIRPRLDWHKGSMALRMMEHAQSAASLLPIFIGNDSADEDAFQALPHGVTIRVGLDRDSAAGYYFDTRRGVEPFLAALLRASAQRAAIL